MHISYPQIFKIWSFKDEKAKDLMHYFLINKNLFFTSYTNLYQNCHNNIISDNIICHFCWNF